MLVTNGFRLTGYVRYGKRERHDNRRRRADAGVAVSARIEGDIDHVELATPRAYVAAFGGQLRITVDFDAERLTLS